MISMIYPREDPKQWIHSSKAFKLPDRAPLPEITLNPAREMAGRIVTEVFPAHSLFKSADELLAGATSFEKNLLSKQGITINLEISTGNDQTAVDYPGYVWVRTDACSIFDEESVYYGVHAFSGEAGTLVDFTSGGTSVNGYDHDDLRALASGMHKLTVLADQ